jgi:hypothetical protein
MYTSVIDLKDRLSITPVNKTIQTQAKGWGFKDDWGEAWHYLRSTTPITQDLLLVSRAAFFMGPIYSFRHHHKLPHWPPSWAD